jgi:hypothetical protein
MSKLFTSALVSGSLLLSACATMVPRGAPGQELIGRTLRVETARGQVSTLLFNKNGAVTAAFGANQIQGKWELDNGQLCFLWGGAPRECWPYARQFRRGQVVPVTSDRGNNVRVTML